MSSTEQTGRHPQRCQQLGFARATTEKKLRPIIFFRYPRRPSAPKALRAKPRLPAATERLWGDGAAMGRRSGYGATERLWGDGAWISIFRGWLQAPGLRRPSCPRRKNGYGAWQRKKVWLSISEFPFPGVAPSTRSAAAKLPAAKKRLWGMAKEESLAFYFWISISGSGSKHPVCGGEAARGGCLHELGPCQQLSQVAWLQILLAPIIFFFY